LFKIFPSSQMDDWVVLFCCLPLAFHISPLTRFPTLAFPPLSQSPCCIPQHVRRMWITLVVNCKILSTHTLIEVCPITLLTTYSPIHNLTIFFLHVLLNKVTRGHQSTFRACRPSGLSSGKHYKFSLHYYFLSVLQS